MELKPSSHNLLTYKKAILWLLLSTVVVSGTAAFGLLYFRHVRDQYAHDDSYRIVAIVQSTPDKEALKTVYLSELLDLSIDNPSNLYRFNAKDAKRKLLACPLIKEASVKKIRPGMIMIDYEMRQPVAFLADYNNTVIDEDGVPFPFNPFFTPKRLPEIYLGASQFKEDPQASNCDWGTQITGPNIDIAKEVLIHINESYYLENTYLRKIDVSNALAPSYGQRQIVVVFEEHAMHEQDNQSVLLKMTHILRLATDRYQEGIDNYFALSPKLLEKKVTIPADNISPVITVPSIIIDLRLNQLGYIK